MKAILLLLLLAGCGLTPYQRLQDAQSQLASAQMLAAICAAGADTAACRGKP